MAERISATASQPDGDSPSPRRLGAALIALLRDHVELVGIELQEQKVQGIRLLVLAGLGLIFALLLLMGLSALLILTFWDSHRLLVCGGLCVFYLGAAIYCMLRLASELDSDISPFRASMEELTQDYESLSP